MCLSPIENIIVYRQQAEEGEKQRHGGEEMPQIVIIEKRCKSKIKLCVNKEYKTFLYKYKKECPICRSTKNYKNVLIILKRSRKSRNPI